MTGFVPGFFHTDSGPEACLPYDFCLGFSARAPQQQQSRVFWEVLFTTRLVLLTISVIFLELFRQSPTVIPSILAGFVCSFPTTNPEQRPVLLTISVNFPGGFLEVSARAPQ